MNKFFKLIRLDSVVRHSIIAVVNLFSKLLLRPIELRKIEGSNRTRVIVSLTSFPARINDVWKTVVSLMNQDYQPDKIILWLAREQHHSIKLLPKSLTRLVSYGLEIRFVDLDYRSHKKYLYAFSEFPNDYVLLVDDDILYPSNTISNLLKDITPEKVHCSYGSIVKYRSDGSICKYSDWTPVFDEYYGDEFFFGSGGGTMLMPSKLCKEVHNIDKALKLCPNADDIWLNAMCRLSHLTINKVRSGLIFPIHQNDKHTLSSINLKQNQNDVQLYNVRKEYPSIFNKKVI